jgi:hypothetical protein
MAIQIELALWVLAVKRISLSINAMSAAAVNWSYPLLEEYGLAIQARSAFH